MLLASWFYKWGGSVSERWSSFLKVLQWERGRAGIWTWVCVFPKSMLLDWGPTVQRKGKDSLRGRCVTAREQLWLWAFTCSDHSPACWTRTIVLDGRGWQRIQADIQPMHLLEAERGLSCNLQMAPEICNVQALSVRMKFILTCRGSE